jgi:hypothetical protein
MRILCEGEAAQQAHSVAVDRNCAKAVALAKRCPNESGERDGGIVGFQQIADYTLVPAIASHNIEEVRSTTLRERILPEHEAVQHRDGVACREKLGNEDRTEIAGTAGGEDFHTKCIP